MWLYPASGGTWVDSSWQFFVGITADKLFDAGYFYFMAIGALLLYIFSYYILSLAQPNEYYQVFLAQGIGARIALGLIFLPAVGVTTHHFRRQKGLATGIVISRSSCGEIVFPAMLNPIIYGYGFAWATRSVAFLSTVLMALAVCYMRTRLPPRSSRPVSKDAAPLPTIKDLVGILGIWSHVQSKLSSLDGLRLLTADSYLVLFSTSSAFSHLVRPVHVDLVLACLFDQSSIYNFSP